MYVCLLINSLFSVPMLAKTKPTRSIPGTAIFVMAELPTVQIQNKILTANTPHMHLTISVPQFSGLKDKQFEETLNKRLLKESKHNKDVFINTVNAYQKDLIQDLNSPIVFEYRESFTPIKSIPPYLIVEQFKYQYNGGAHGDSQYQYLVIDTARSKIISLRELFKDNVDYKSVLSNKISQMITERVQQGAFYFSGSDGFQSIKDDQPFYINQKGELVIVFNIYEIAPYAAGTQYFSIPRSELTPYLK